MDNVNIKPYLAVLAGWGGLAEDGKWISATFLITFDYQILFREVFMSVSTCFEEERAKKAIFLLTISNDYLKYRYELQER
ncbi:MAG: hypothetical protein KAI59_01115 [Planctomycetes bacterium]|nr:hypothetical protein [Planctomycetota bacterium]